MMHGYIHLIVRHQHDMYVEHSIFDLVKNAYGMHALGNLIIEKKLLLLLLSTLFRQ